MTVHFNTPGKKKKELATEIAAWLGEDVRYCGAPTFAYEIDRFQVDRDGNLTCSDLVDANVVERLLQHLHEEGFKMDMSEDTETAEESTDLAIQMPLTQVNVGNLTKILDAKGSLIKKALGIEDLRFGLYENRVDFPWFQADTAPDELNAYIHFITALCEMSKNQKRINAKEKAVDNEKYAFRCFLLRLGFIGDEFKGIRRILLKNLTGSTAFKSGAKKEVLSNAISQ